MGRAAGDPLKSTAARNDNLFSADCPAFVPDFRQQIN